MKTSQLVGRVFEKQNKDKELLIEKLNRQKKFLVFAGERFYANGGANDLLTTDCKTLEEAIEHAKDIFGKNFGRRDEYGDISDGNEIEWVQVFDLELCEVVFRKGAVYGNDNGIEIL